MSVPTFDADIADVAGLARIGELLFATVRRVRALAGTIRP